METLSVAARRALDEARRKHEPGRQRRLSAHEHAMFLDLLVASVHPTLTVAAAVDLRETIREAWLKRWSALRLPACVAWFEEHKALGFPMANAIAEERLDALATTLVSDVPPMLARAKPRVRPSTDSAKDECESAR